MTVAPRREVGRGQFKLGGCGAVGFASLLAVVASVGPSAQAQQQPTFRSRVAVVPITAVVHDSRNRVVKNLRQEDFQVLEEGIPRRLLDFSANTNGPISIAVLFDTSGSMGMASNLAKGKDVVSRLVDAIRPEQDEIALFTFHRTLRQEVPFSSDRMRLSAALEQVRPWGMTSLYDAVGETAKRLALRSSTTRRAVVVVSDGLDTSSSLSYREAAMLASAIDVPVYVVAVVSPLDDPAHDLSVGPPATGGALRDLAEFTGGEAFHVSGIEASLTTDSLLSTLRHQYLLAIESSTEPGTYALQVVTKRKGLQVRARRAYSAGVGADGLQ